MNRLPYATTKKWPAHLLLFASLSLWPFATSAAPKTDIVIFKNGDKLTGEFKLLKRGQLSLNTEATGTIGIEWDKVSTIVSKQRIQVETNDGTRYFGSLTSSKKSSRIIVVTDDGPQTLEMARVIVMTPIEGGGVHALDVDAMGVNIN